MKKYILLLLALSLIMGLVASTVFSYDLGNPGVDSRNEYSRVTLDGAQTIGTPGDPALPWFGVKLLIPLGTSATLIKVERSNPKTIDLVKAIAPIQQQYPFSYSGRITPDLPNPFIYSSDEGFPVVTDNGLRTEFLAGHSLAFTAVCPFEYHPLRSELVYYSRLTVTIESSPSEAAAAARRLLRQDGFITRQLLSSVDNGDAVPRYEERTTGNEYIIIHDAAKTAQWQPLKDIYTEKGYQVLMKSVQDITASVTGADTQEKIRNYLISMFPGNSLRYVLLAGDTDVIPHRGFTVNMGQGGESDSDIPADMYYNCLDGNWNTDNDANWGEMYESDFAPEFAIGRICYNNDTEIANQINKIMGYLIIPVETEVKSAFFAGEWLWEGPTWGGDYMDEMIGGSSTNGYTTVGVPTSWSITTLYDRTYGAADSWGAAQIQPMLSQGPNLVNHLGHSNTTYTMRLNNGQVTNNTITNNGTNHNFSIYFTQGCYSGSFDNRDTNPGSYVGDCITEKMTSIANSATGMIAHSRYGWGSQGSTDGASQYIHRQYMDAIFGENIHELGWTLVDSKIDNIPYINNQPVMYWVDYETNLFGDPALMIWTDTPQPIQAQLPPAWMIGVNNYQIQTNAPDASMRIKQGSTIIFEGTANGSGLINVSLLSPLTPGTYQMFINAPNHYSYQGTFQAVATQMPYIVCTSVAVNTPNNLIETEHTYSLNCTVKNVGMVNQANAGTMMLTSNSPNINVLSPALNFNALASGDSIVIANAFNIRVTGSYPDQTLALLGFNSSFDSFTSQSSGNLTLNAPVLSLSSYQIVNSGGQINPGDSPTVTVTLDNTGSGNCYSPMLLLMEDSPYFSLSASDVYFNQVDPGQTASTQNSFTINVSESAPDGEILSFNYVLISENDQEETGTISFNTGLMSYTFEPDFQNWATTTLQTGFVNQWHRSSNRNHTNGGGFSAKFGGTGATAYANSSYGALISPEMPLGVNSRLKYYQWIAAEQHTNPQYAWDGGNVEISVNNGPWTLITPVGGYPYVSYNNDASPFNAGTPIFSGTHDWQEITFELPQYSGTAKFRFVFGADGYVNAEGWYIDDVRLESDPVENNDPNQIQAVLKLIGNYPNPFNPATTISFSNTMPSDLDLSIYNLRGQLVKTLVNGMTASGSHSVIWNGTDDNNRQVSSGVYYYRLSSSGKVQTGKMLMIK